MNRENSNFLFTPLAFFMLGFAYYLIIPFFIIKFCNLYELSPVEAVIPYLDISFFNISYFYNIVVVFLSFYFGFKLALCFKVSDTPSLFDPLSTSRYIPKFLFLLSLSLSCLLMYKFKRNGGVFFSGYTQFDIAFLGQLSTLTFLSFFFFNFFKGKAISVLFIFLTLSNSVVLLGLGSRNIVVNGIITALIGIIYKNRKILFSFKFYLFIFSFILFVLFIGVWRTGFKLKVGTLLGILFAEPVFVISSAALYFESLFSKPFIAFPREFLITFVNFLPTFLYPQKVNLINSYMGSIQQFSPFGASSILVGLFSNFGYMFFVYVMSLGVFYGYFFKKAKNSIFYRCIYFSIAPLLIFQFYNQFIYSFFKLLFWNGIIVPTLIFFLLSRFEKMVFKK